MADWRSRIVRYDPLVDPAVLTPHPDNPRKHPAKQRALLEKVMRAGGVVSPIVAADGSKHILDGHLRHEVALTAGVKALQVVWLDVTETEEPVFLATFDQVGTLAVNDDAALDTMIQAVGRKVDPEILDWLISLAPNETVEAVPDDAVSNAEDEDDWIGGRWRVRDATVQRRIQLLVTDAEYDVLGSRFDALETAQGITERTDALLWLLRKDGVMK
jgi:hypothetical protein